MILKYLNIGCEWFYEGSIKNNDYNVKDIYLIDENKTLSIMFAGTGDLYWIIKNTNINENDEYSYDSFEITKEKLLQIYYLISKVLMILNLLIYLMKS